MSSSDLITVTTTVALDPATAFAVFTGELGTWWKRGPRYRFDSERDGTMRLEPGIGGRLLEVYDEAGDDCFVVGNVLVWEPAARMVLEWRAQSFAPSERTEVEVRFAAVDGGTRVTIEHRGWDRLRRDHPARKGLAGPAFTSLMGLWWADQLVAFAAQRGRASPRR